MILSQPTHRLVHPKTYLIVSPKATFTKSKYRITSLYSNALRTSQTCSFSEWYHILHPKIAFEAPWSCACCGMKYVYDITLHPSVNWCWKTLLFEYLAAIRYTRKVFFDYEIKITSAASNNSCWQAALCHCGRPAQYVHSCIHTYIIYVMYKVCT